MKNQIQVWNAENSKMTLEEPTFRKWYILSGIVREYNGFKATLISEDDFRCDSGFNYSGSYEEMQKYAKETFNIEIPNKNELYEIRVNSKYGPEYIIYEPKIIKNNKFFDCWCCYGITQEEKDSQIEEFELLEGVEVFNK